MKKSILALGVLFAISAPVMAGEYYIVHGQDRHCNVVERIPVVSVRRHLDLYESIVIPWRRSDSRRRRCGRTRTAAYTTAACFAT